MPVCITGMHRSGTSMVAKLLRESGLYLGPDADIMPAADENPEGFWENVKFVELNEELLSRLGSGWDCPPPLQSDWSAPAIAALRPAAAALTHELARQGDWGWKDPRTSYTLPFWQLLLSDLRVVLVLRNPLEVARSLRQRNGFSYALGLSLWRISYQRVIEAIPAANRVVTHYDAYFAQPEIEYQRVLGLLGMPLMPEVIDGFRQSNADRLRHHRFNLQDLAEASIDPSIRDLYQTLCQEAEWSDTTGPAGTSPAEHAGLNLGAFDTTARGIGGANRLTIENGLLRQALTDVKGDYHREVEDRDQQIDAMQATIAEQVEEIARGDVVRSALSEVEATAARLRVAAHDLTERLSIAEVRIRAGLNYEDDIRKQLTSAHEQLIYRDAEVMATLGIALARHAPGAPAAIYYRQLVERVTEAVVAHLPAGAPVAVASLGDEAMLLLDGRPAWHFPDPADEAESAYSAAGAERLLAKIVRLRQRGAQYLIMPASSWSWAARFPDLMSLILSRYTNVVRDDRVCMIYDLRAADSA